MPLRDDRGARLTATAYNHHMGRPAAVVRMTYAEYLAAEAVVDVRHEYLAGDVWAMAGGTIEHGGLAVAVARDIGLALRGKPCRAFSSDVRVRIRETDLATDRPDARALPALRGASRREILPSLVPVNCSCGVHPGAGVLSAGSAEGARMIRIFVRHDVANYGTFVGSRHLREVGRRA